MVSLRIPARQLTSFRESSFISVRPFAPNQAQNPSIKTSNVNRPTWSRAVSPSPSSRLYGSQQNCRRIGRRNIGLWQSLGSQKNIALQKTIRYPVLHLGLGQSTQEHPPAGAVPRFVHNAARINAPLHIIRTHARQVICADTLLLSATKRLTARGFHGARCTGNVYK